MQRYPKPEDLTDFDLLYSRSKGINKRRHPNEGIYPIPELDSRKKFKIKFKYNQTKEKFVQKVNLEINTNQVTIEHPGFKMAKQQNQSALTTKRNSSVKTGNHLVIKDENFKVSKK
jgi:hypothetical protein